MRDNVMRFVDFLKKLASKEDRASLAKLRRGLGKQPGEAMETASLIMPYAPKYQESMEHYFRVASLFAFHPMHQDGMGMGKVFSRLAREVGESSERRFIALLDCNVEDLDHHLRSAVGLARSKQIGIDYARLLDDLLHWTHPDRYIQLRLAREFWGSSDEDASKKDK